MSIALDNKIREIIVEAFRQLSVSKYNINKNIINTYSIDGFVPDDSNSDKKSDIHVLSNTSTEIAKVTSLVIPDQVEPFFKSSSPLLQYARSSTAHGNNETEPLLNLLKDVFEYLPWKYNYEERADKKDLGSFMGWAELIGPEAPYRTDKYCLGFTLISPDTIYPEHNHPAIEIYKVLSGTANWTLEGVTAARKPGEVILHESMKRHKMQTFDETLLALYAWSGSDVVTLSTYTE
jgi:mannose-6-phosphate isomerase-like protein (cupin superfamily)